MNPEIRIREEIAADIPAISELTIAAFKTLEISDQTEQFVIEALRAAKGLTLSPVAERDGRLVGPYCPLPCHHFGRHAQLVWAWPCFRAAGVPTQRHRPDPYPGRTIPVKKPEGTGMLSGGASGLLPQIRIPAHSGTGA